ncbi:MAG TPA: type II toxin-antitoxin system VapC family toxin [Urbifossiella sp.]|jgi:PIN domain nuclease of toxin-antitoxin system|nr:type II toxin-antitoxin system VapC family toxin [Urbifossiella sp.]
MTALLDTHVFVWMDTDVSLISPAALRYFADPNCTILLSVVSVWEVAIKAGTGKLALSAPLGQVIQDIRQKNPLQILSVELSHALAVQSLPAIHRDPFDRMLVAQAIVENAVLLTADARVRQYPVQTDW